LQLFCDIEDEPMKDLMVDCWEVDCKLLFQIVKNNIILHQLDDEHKYGQLGQNTKYNMVFSLSHDLI
jgi:hypothetical protein